MTSKDVILILYNKVSEEASKDEIDILCQVDAVSAALEKLGYTASIHPFSGNPGEIIDAVNKTKPLLVFNLVETVLGQGRLSYLAPSILETLDIKFTGSSAESILLTTDKIITKKLLRSCGIPTPQWITIQDDNGFAKDDRYIVKTVYEDGSVGIFQDSIVAAENIDQLRSILESKKKKNGRDFFAEKYIAGREINISLVGDKGKPIVLPPGEIKFIGYKEKNIEEILDYHAKWEEDSFEFKNTISSNSFDKKDDKLLKELADISAECWREFGLKGYARVDFRIDREGRPWVLEINANPCIAPEGSGFILSAARAGLDYKEVIGRIIAEI